MMGTNYSIMVLLNCNQAGELEVERLNLELHNTGVAIYRNFVYNPCFDALIGEIRNRRPDDEAVHGIFSRYDAVYWRENDDMVLTRMRVGR